jgi:hypothetical protein
MFSRCALRSDGETVDMIQHDLLRKLPGVTASNYWKIISTVRDLRELSNMSVEELTPLMSVGNARKLHTFFNRRTRGSGAARAVVIDVDGDGDGTGTGFLDKDDGDGDGDGDGKAADDDDD